MRLALTTACLLLLSACLESNPQPAPGTSDRADSSWLLGTIDIQIAEETIAPKQDLVPAPDEDVHVGGMDLGPAPADLAAETVMDVAPYDMAPDHSEVAPDEIVVPPDDVFDILPDSVEMVAETVEEIVDPPEVVDVVEAVEEDVVLLGETSFIGGGTFFGMCFGACKMDVTVDGDKVNFVASNWDETVYVDNNGTLTAEGLAGAQALALELVGVELQEVYGCPDCADGGGAYVVLLRDGKESKHTYSFNQPPPELELAETFSKVLRDALAGCQSNTLIVVDEDCGPLG